MFSQTGMTGSRVRLYIPTTTKRLVDLLSWRFSYLNRSKFQDSQSLNPRHQFLQHMNKVQTRIMGHVEYSPCPGHSENVTEQLAGLFNPFSSEYHYYKQTHQHQNKNKGYRQVLQNQVTPDPKLDALEDKMLYNLAATLSKSRFHLISHSELEYSLQSQYRFTLPVFNDWAKFARQPFARVQDRLYTHVRDHPRPALNFSRVMIFHRGVGVDRSRGLYYSEKLDEIVRRVRIGGLKRVVNATYYGLEQVESVLKSGFRHVNEASQYRAAKTLKWFHEAIEEASVRLIAPKHRDALNELTSEISRRWHLVLQGQQALPAAHQDDQVDETAAMEATRIVQVDDSSNESSSTKPYGIKHTSIKPKATVKSAPQRPTLGSRETVTFDSQTKNSEQDTAISDSLLRRAFLARRCLGDIPMTLRTFFGYITLQEPTFKEVVVVYRDLAPRLPPPELLEHWNETGSGSIKATTSPSSHLELTNVMEVEPNLRNIHVEVYQHVPMSDVELLFPHTRTAMRPFDKVMLSISMAFAFGTAIPLIMQPATVSKAWLAAFVASVSYQLRVMMRTYNSWLYYQTLTSTLLADKLVASGPPASEWVKYSAEEQVFKEMAVTYVALCELYKAKNLNVTSQNYGFSVEEVNSQAVQLLQSLFGSNYNQFQSLGNLHQLVQHGLAVEVQPSSHSETVVSRLGPQRRFLPISILED